MLLLLDIGNTRLKWAMSQNRDLQQTGHVGCADLDQQQLIDLFDRLPAPDEIWISNVGSAQVLADVIDVLESIHGLAPQIVTVDQPVGSFKNAYRQLQTLGVDRWVAAIGARVCVPESDLIIIDAGTAITIDCLDSDNTFQGGVILPGHRLMNDALVGGTSGIDSDYRPTKQIIGKTTIECVNSGTDFGLAGAVERIVREIKQQVDPAATTVITGGGAHMVIEKTNLNAHFEPDLMLHGLLRIARC
jgi:type III pantothenate kinase